MGKETVVFMGTPEFAVPALRALCDNGFTVQAVVTQPDRPRGRGRRPRPSAVKMEAQRLGLKVLQPEKASDLGFIQEVEGLSPDFLVVAAYGQILKAQLLKVPRLMPVNIHASLLPSLRGAAPIQWAILRGEKRTGITIMRMDEGMDTGPILLKEEVEIASDETFGTLHDKLSRLGASLIVRAIRGVLEGSIKEVRQPEEGISYAPPISKDLLEINWEEPAEKVHRVLRAFDPIPGAYSFLKGKRVRLFIPRIIESYYSGGGKAKYVAPGTVLSTDNGILVVQCKDVPIGIEEIQWPGKRRMRVEEFLRGRPIEKGTVLGEKRL